MYRRRSAPSCHNLRAHPAGPVKARFVAAVVEGAAMIYRVAVTGVGSISNLKTLCILRTRATYAEGLSQEPDLRGVRQRTPVWLHFVTFTSLGQEVSMLKRIIVSLLLLYSIPSAAGVTSSVAYAVWPVFHG
jgi:hypothetical protein